MITVLALDIAMHRTGWAYGSPDGTRPFFGVFETENWKNNEGRELHRFRQFLCTLDPPTHLAIEEVFVNVKGGGNQFQFNGTQAQMMLSGVALEWAEQLGVKQFQIEIDDWRKRFLGLNRKPKDAKGDDMYWKTLALKVAAQRNWYCEHHDEAEALGILDYTLAQLDLPYRDRTNVHLNRQHVDQIKGRGLHAR